MGYILGIKVEKKYCLPNRQSSITYIGLFGSLGICLGFGYRFWSCCYLGLAETHALSDRLPRIGKHGYLVSLVGGAPWPWLIGNVWEECCLANGISKGLGRMQVSTFLSLPLADLRAQGAARQQA